MNTSLPKGFRPPEQLEEYRLVRLLGRGAMGEVYLAQDTVLDRRVAIKFLAQSVGSPGSRERLMVEARAAARLAHPNVVTVFRVGEVDHHLYIVSEFIHGESLASLAKPVPWQKGLEIGLALARGLATAHRRGVLHRDIKPANAIISESGEVKLLDFGLAKFVEVALAETVPPTEEHVPVPLEAPRAMLPRIGDPTRTLPDALSDTLGQEERAEVPGPLLQELTRTGDLVGTPLYMAPEIWAGEAATARSDVYSLGAVLYELCSGQAPNRDLLTLLAGRPAQGLDGETLRQLLRGHTRSLQRVAPTVDVRFGQLIDRCLRLDPAERFASAEQLLQGLEAIAVSAAAAALPEGNPYRGLHPFDAEHRALFFGRRREIVDVLEMLRAQPCVVVAGSSGVGKSSLCRAGVLPRVVEGALGARTWQVISLFPGKHPLRALALAMAPLLGAMEEELEGQLRQDPAMVLRALRKQQRSDEGLLLFFDQLEELVTLSEPAEAHAVAQLLEQLADDASGLRVLAALRADFVAVLAELPGLARLLSRGLFVLPGLSIDGIREAIVMPARLKGVSFESEALIEALTGPSAQRLDRSSAEATLPLLQFALAELWDARDVGKNAITAEALEKMGGVDGALSRHADSVLARLLPRQRAAARTVLLRLVTAEGTRTRRSHGELVGDDGAAREALDALVNGRLIVAREGDGQVVYELTHEALIHGWPTLRDWLDEAKDSRVVQQRLERAAAEWERLGKARDALWGTAQLAETGAMDRSTLSTREQAFLTASRNAVRRSRLVWRAVALSFALVVAGVYSAARYKANHERTVAVEAHVRQATELLASARTKDGELQTLRKQALEKFDTGKREEGERIWSRVLVLARQADEAYGRGAEELEAAMVLDSSRADVRAALGDALYESALAAERDGRTAERDAHVRRLALYDSDGARLRKWNQPGAVTIETLPPGAEVKLERYVSDGQGRLFPKPVRDLGKTPLVELILPQGSYRLLLASPGRVATVYPFLLRRAARLHLSIALPKAADIPDGFVYVPAGRFLFGSADESRRGTFFNTAPLHEVETGAYLIARHETTFKEWIAYLASLSGAERRRRIPKVAAGFASRHQLELTEQGKTWVLDFGPNTETYRAAIGEEIRYQARETLVLQDWMKFPVSAVSVEDARAYAMWLGQSRKLPGARLCTDYEWEKAARGADGRNFPHGELLSPADANFDETYGKQPAAFGPDEVGSHPTSRSPFGVDDMVGNVFEWTESFLGQNEAVARGGSFYYAMTVAALPNREPAEPTLRDLSIGVRICANSPAP